MLMRPSVSKYTLCLLMSISTCDPEFINITTITYFVCLTVKASVREHPNLLCYVCPSTRRLEFLKIAL
jgi:hypothetical protein